MDKCTHEVRLMKWKQIISECESRPANVSKRQWLEENGITFQTYYLWQRKIRQEMYDTYVKDKDTLPAPVSKKATEISFAEIAVPAIADHTIKTDIPFVPAVSISIKNGYSINISNDVSSDLLLKLFEVINHVG